MNVYVMLAFTRSTLNPNPVLVELFETLEREGIGVEIGVANELVFGPDQAAARHDLYILKSHSPLWLSLAGILHSQGARMLNPYPSCFAAHDKIMAERRLEAAGIPTPTSWVTGDLCLLRRAAAEQPLVIKPYHGGRGVGVVFVRDPGDLAAMEPPQQPMLAQEYIPGDELKVYVIGDDVFGVRKSDSVRTPSAVSAEVRDIALRCGRAFGLGLYGLDVIESASGPVVIDLNYFPSYKGIPGAAGLLARYIVDYASGRRPSLMLPEPPQAAASVVPVAVPSAA